jgi:hypothetical protein
MSFIQRLGQLRAAVSTYASLPTSGNVLGDLRIVADLGVLYTWMIESSSGTLTDWKKVTVSSYQDLRNRPSVTPLAIDNATTNIRNIYLNYVYLFFMSMAAISINVMKMFDGFIDALITEDGIDLTKTSNQRRILVPTMQNYAGYYLNDFDGSLDGYTKLLIHGFNLNDDTTDFFDGLLNDIARNDTTVTVTNTKFGNKSLLFDGSSNSYLLLESFYNNPGVGIFSNDGNPFRVDGLDFTWDMCFRCDADSAETIMVDHQFNHNDGTNFKIEKTAAKKIKISLRGCTDYSWDNQNVPVDPVSYDVTGTTSIEKETWYHLAIVRQNGYIKIYINGVLDGTSSVADTQNIIDYLNEMVIGNGNGLFLGKGFTGRIEEVRFSKGIARYTTTFTPRTTPYNTPTQSSPCNNMVIQSEGYEANSIPTCARIVVFEQDGILGYNPDLVETVTPNTDIKVFLSRDGGTTFTQATDLKVELDINQEVIWTSLYSNVNFLVGTVDLTGQPSGKEMVWKITTHNNKNILIRSIALNWK